jgi:hypothetical protein
VAIHCRSESCRQGEDTTAKERHKANTRCLNFEWQVISTGQTVKENSLAALAMYCRRMLGHEPIVTACSD